MLDEIDKFRVQIFQISGFALMTPFGKIFLEPWTLFRELGIYGVASYFILTLILELFGISLILKSYDILEKNRKRNNR